MVEHFELKECSGQDTQARLGSLRLQQRSIIHTPHYVAVSSRGTLPHLTPDNLRDLTDIHTVYSGLEEFVEQLPEVPPVLQVPCKDGQSPLRQFTALQQDALLVVGPRRTPPIGNPSPNTSTSMTIRTSKGFRQLEIADYISVGLAAKSDILIGPADIVHDLGDVQPGAKRKDKMDERTAAWMRGMLKAAQESSTENSTQLWAPMLPFEKELQQSYLSVLHECDPSTFGGLALYEDVSVFNIPSSLHHLPRISLSVPTTPQAVLRAVDLGADLVTTSFVNVATEAGIAFSFKFPAPTVNGGKLPLGYSLWNASFADDLGPLETSCECIACKSHHRAYIRHLLDAKEMLAWVLLQVHNHAQMDIFFTNIRESLSAGTFAADLATFNQAYLDEMPTDGGEGPRLRGYQMKSSTPGPAKANLPARRKLNKADKEAIEAAKAEKHRTKLDDNAQKLAEAIDGDLELFTPHLLN